ncbi:MAG: MBL fold metallo-hydrolase, partial [Syntrophales bacterium]
MNNLTVRELWVHTPWNFAKDFIDLFKDGRLTDNSLKEKLREGLNIAHEIEQLAKAKRITIREPYSGLSFDNGVIKILGPSENYYSELLACFKKCYR